MERFVLLIIGCCFVGPAFSYTRYGWNGYNKLSEEIVMEHDVTLDEYTLLPFLKSLLGKIGFRRQRTFADFIRNSVLERRQANQTRSYLNVRLNRALMTQSTKAIYEALTNCHQLKRSIRRMKPIFSILLRGGKTQAKLLAKKFSTKLPVKRCRAILTVHCIPPVSPRGRSQRSRRI